MKEVVNSMSQSCVVRGETFAPSPKLQRQTAERAVVLRIPHPPLWNHPFSQDVDTSSPRLRRRLTRLRLPHPRHRYVHSKILPPIPIPSLHSPTTSAPNIDICNQQAGYTTSPNSSKSTPCSRANSSPASSTASSPPKSSSRQSIASQSSSPR